jgi:hypothetical protein
VLLVRHEWLKNDFQVEKWRAITEAELIVESEWPYDLRVAMDFLNTLRQHGVVFDEEYFEDKWAK